MGAYHADGLARKAKPLRAVFADSAVRRAAHCAFRRHASFGHRAMLPAGRHRAMMRVGMGGALAPRCRRDDARRFGVRSALAIMPYYTAHTRMRAEERHDIE